MLEIIITLLKFLGLSTMIGVGWWAMKKIFKWLFYPDERLIKRIKVLPTSTGIEINGKKLGLYFTVINLSLIYNIKIEVKDAYVNGYEIKKFTLQNAKKNIIKRMSIGTAYMERDILDEAEKKGFSGEVINRMGVNVNIKIKILANNWFFGDRVIEEECFRENKTLVRYII